jgi:hypothetical protein
MTSNDKSSLPLMDNPTVRTARINLRLAELRLLAARTAFEFGREQELPLALIVKQAMQQAMKRARLKRTGSDGHGPKD